MVGEPNKDDKDPIAVRQIQNLVLQHVRQKTTSTRAATDDPGHVETRIFRLSIQRKSLSPNKEEARITAPC